jgi:hypothetical protein
MKKELHEWQKVKERHMVKLKPFIYAEKDLSIIILSEIIKAKKEVFDDIDRFVIVTTPQLYEDLKKKHLEEK